MQTLETLHWKSWRCYKMNTMAQTNIVLITLEILETLKMLW